MCTCFSICIKSKFQLTHPPIHPICTIPRKKCGILLYLGYYFEAKNCILIYVFWIFNECMTLEDVFVIKKKLTKVQNIIHVFILRVYTFFGFSYLHSPFFQNPPTNPSLLLMPNAKTVHKNEPPLTLLRDRNPYNIVYSIGKKHDIFVHVLICKYL